MEGGGDGSYCGVEYFTCPLGRGLFVPLIRLKTDDRFVVLDDVVEEGPKPEPTPHSERSTNPVNDPFSNLMSNIRTGGSKEGTRSMFFSFCMMAPISGF